MLTPVPVESDNRELAEEAEAGAGYRRQPAKLLAGNQSADLDSGSVSPSGGSRLPLIMAGRQQQSRLQARGRGEDEEPWQSQVNRWGAAVLTEPGRGSAVAAQAVAVCCAYTRHMSGICMVCSLQAASGARLAQVGEYKEQIEQQHM